MTMWPNSAGANGHRTCHPWQFLFVQGFSTKSKSISSRSDPNAPSEAGGFLPALARLRWHASQCHA